MNSPICLRTSGILYSVAEVRAEEITLKLKKEALDSIEGAVRVLKEVPDLFQEEIEKEQRTILGLEQEVVFVKRLHEKEMERSLDYLDKLRRCHRQLVKEKKARIDAERKLAKAEDEMALCVDMISEKMKQYSADDSPTTTTATTAASTSMSTEV